MNNLRVILYGVGFLFVSLAMGVLFSFIVGSRLPEKLSLVSSKSFEANEIFIWQVLVDIESYPLWKPNVKRVEMLGKNDKGLTKWREHSPLKKSLTYEITEFSPMSLLEIRVIEAKDDFEGIWIYKLSNYQGSGILQVKHYVILRNYIDRFIRRYIDTKYSEADHMLMALGIYTKQLLEDQEEVLDIIAPKIIENTESPLR